MTRSLVTISPDQGFHFLISYDIQAKADNNEDNNCESFILQTFPVDVFVDPFELINRQKEGVFTKFSIWGETDLEKPVSAVRSSSSRTNGSVVLMGPITSSDISTGLQLPIHARYPLPLAQEMDGVTHSLVIIPTPTQLRICNSDWSHSPYAIHALPSWLEVPYAKSHVLSSIPFNTKEEQPLRIRVPTGVQAHFEIVHSATLFTVLMAAAYLVYVSGALSIQKSRTLKKKNKHT